MINYIELIKETIKNKQNIVFFISVRKNELRYISKFSLGDTNEKSALCTEFYRELKKYIDSIQLEYNKEKSVKIINWVNDENDIYLLHRNKYFSKIENIYFTDRDFTKIEHKHTIKLLKDYNNQAKSNNTLLSTHWINWLINTPAEFKGRMMQPFLTGGCWLYAAFNVLLFTPTIKQKMINKMKLYHQSKNVLKEKFPITYNEIIENTDNTIEDIIFSIIWFIENNEHYAVENYMIVLAARIKGVFQTNSEARKTWPKLSKIINEYDIFEEIINKEHLYKICRANDSNKIRKKLCDTSHTKTLEETNTLAELNAFCHYDVFKKDICTSSDEKVEYDSGYIFGSGAYANYSVHHIISIIFKKSVLSYSTLPRDTNNDPNDVEYLDYDFKFDNLTKHFREVPVYDINLHSIFNSFNITVFQIDNLFILNIIVSREIRLFLFKEQLSFHGRDYKLCGSVWETMSEHHAICGMINNDDVYMYDSRGILIRTDWRKSLHEQSFIY